jgi:hypothetical protein
MCSRRKLILFIIIHLAVALHLVVLLIFRRQLCELIFPPLLGFLPSPLDNATFGLPFLTLLVLFLLALLRRLFGRASDDKLRRSCATVLSSPRVEAQEMEAALAWLPLPSWLLARSIRDEGNGGSRGVAIQTPDPQPSS